MEADHCRSVRSKVRLEPMVTVGVVEVAACFLECERLCRPRELTHPEEADAALAVPSHLRRCPVLNEAANQR